MSDSIRSVLKSFDEEDGSYTSEPLLAALEEFGVNLDAQCPPESAWLYTWWHNGNDAALCAVIGELVGRLCSASAIGMYPGGRVRNAKLSRAKLDGLYLSGSNLSSASLVSTRLTGADLSGCCFRRADLRDTKLSGAEISGADFFGARRRVDDAPIPGWVLVKGRLRKVHADPVPDLHGPDGSEGVVPVKRNEAPFPSNPLDIEEKHWKGSRRSDKLRLLADITEELEKLPWVERVDTEISPYTAWGLHLWFPKGHAEVGLSPYWVHYKGRQYRTLRDIVAAIENEDSNDF